LGSPGNISIVVCASIYVFGCVVSIWSTHVVKRVFSEKIFLNFWVFFYLHFFFFSCSTLSSLGHRRFPLEFKPRSFFSDRPAFLNVFFSSPDDYNVHFGLDFSFSLCTHFRSPTGVNGVKHRL